MVKVVVAEDDLHVARFIARALTALGYCSVICRDGRRALNVLEDNPDTALLVTDVAMGNMDGRALVEAVRAQERYSKLPIIIMSGAVCVPEIADLIDVGVTCYLGKPVELDELQSYARSLVGKSVAQ